MRDSTFPDLLNHTGEILHQVSCREGFKAGQHICDFPSKMGVPSVELSALMSMDALLQVAIAAGVPLMVIECGLKESPISDDIPETSPEAKRIVWEYTKLSQLALLMLFRQLETNSSDGTGASLNEALTWAKEEGWPRLTGQMWSPPALQARGEAQ